jgi:class 3 adenylate cyclase
VKYDLDKMKKNDSSDESVNLTPKKTSSDYLVSFSGQSESYCVGMVDIVNSTKITHQMSHDKIAQYYQIFLNSMGSILGRFGGIVIKNIGDSLLYYFPESSKHKRKYGFMSCLEANLAIIEEHQVISNQLLEHALPSLDYRVSTDYGPCMIMKSNNSSVTDMVGPPMNMCSKINRSAAVNGIIIGSDFYEVVKDFDDYEFKRAGDHSIGLKHSYPLYSVCRKN